MSVKKEIDNLHYKYLFSIAHLNPEEQHVLLEEEKVFYKHVFENQSSLFNFNGKRNNLRELDNFTNYTKQLIQNVHDNYMKVFRDRSLNIKDTDLSNIERIFDVNLSSLNKTLETQLADTSTLDYITCVLLCSSLLFLIRTTKRALFIFISQDTQGTENRNFDIFTNVNYVIEYITSFISSINESVDSQKQIYEDFQKTKVNLLSEKEHVAKIENQYNNCVDNIKYLEDKKFQLEKRLTDKDKVDGVLLDRDNELLALKREKETLIHSIKQLDNNIKECNEKLSNMLKDMQNKLDECRAENNKLRYDPDLQKQMNEKATRDTEDFKRSLSAIINLAQKFKNMLDRWEVDVDNRELILTKISNHIETLEDDKLNLIKLGIKLLQPINIQYKYINQVPKFQYVAELIVGLVNLRDRQIIERNVDMEMFFDTKELYKTLVLLFEDLSGAVRVVVKVRNNQQPVAAVGGKRKIGSYNVLASNKKRVRRTLIGGSVFDPEFQNYIIELDRKSMKVTFENLPKNDLFKNEPREFGPFFSVHDSLEFTHKDKDVTSTELDIIKSMQFDTLKLMFENDLDPNEKPPALLLYTYGYSGSGKTYTLFGELNTREGQPQKGIFWKIIDELKKHYDLSFESTSKCYGYLKQDEQNPDSVKFFNDAKRGYNSEKPVIDQVKENTNKWSGYIMSLLGKTQDVDSFIKTTSNNPESSRGFLILKIGVYSKNEKRELKGYIGVIDMAGSEDPYDIAASLCPTMDFSKMNNLIKSKLQGKDIVVSDYDSFYTLVQEQISDIIAPSIICYLLTQNLGYKKGLSDIAPYIKIHNEYANQLKEFPILNSLFNDIKRLIEFILNGDESGITPSTTWIPLRFDTDRDGKNKIVTFIDKNVNETIFLFNLPTKTVTFYLSRTLLLEVLGLLKKKFPYSGSRHVSIDDIKKQLHLKADINTLTAMKIIYSEQALPDKTFTDTFEIKFPTTAAKTYNIKNIIRDIKSEIINSFRKLFYCNKPYFIPFITDSKNKEIYIYNYNTINRIISEGFYINKANAELINYFDKKLKMQQDKSYQYVETPYKFNENFDYNSKTNTKNTETKNTFITQDGMKVNEYNTNLITLLTSMFPGKNKDILITCVRDDKEYGKVKGALDTLKLVEDLKST